MTTGRLRRGADERPATAVPAADLPGTAMPANELPGTDLPAADDGPRGELTIDCASCLARPAACGDCIVSVLLGPPGAIGGEEQAAFAVLAGSGLVPPLRLVTGREGVA
jgi:hypothetical protein